jgi:hypothetical protein
MKRRAEVTIASAGALSTSFAPGSRRSMPTAKAYCSVQPAPCSTVHKWDRGLDCLSSIRYIRACGDAVIIEGLMHALRERLLPSQLRLGVRVR